MARNRRGLELRLNELFAQGAPKLPRGGKRALVLWMPFIALILGIVALMSAWGLWHWAHAADNAIEGVCNAYSVSGCGNIPPSRFSLWLWLGVIFVATEGVLYLIAYPGLRDRRKEGWDYMYYGMLLNTAYAGVSLFTEYNRIGHFLGGILMSIAGFYLLFQVRRMYMLKRHGPAPNPQDQPEADHALGEHALADSLKQTRKQ